MPIIPQPLSALCDVTVSVSAAGAAVPQFNQALCIGQSTAIPISARLRLYIAGNYAAQMITDGFTLSSPEYLAAEEYFNPDPSIPAPQYLWVGRQDLTSIASSIPVAEGAGYAIGDQFSVTGGGGSGAIGQVTAETAGAVTAYTLLALGTGYAVTAAAATAAITGSGAGLTIDIETIGDTPEVALAACRVASQAWYLAFFATGVTDTQHLACMLYAQSATPAMQYVFYSGTAATLNGTSASPFLLGKTAGYSRAHGMYATTSTAGNIYGPAAVCAVAMGLNTGAAGSAFTLSAKPLAGISPEPITQAQINALMGIPGVQIGNCNLLLNYANTYQWYQQGINIDGKSWFDQILGIDMLAADAQISVLNVVGSLGSIPDDDAGQTLVLNAVNGACDRALARGFLEPNGVWTGPTVLNVTAGTALPNGYRAQSAAFSSQSPSDRALRKGMPVYVTIILAGSQQSFTIGINVQQ
jgi:hypothetical protein